MAVTKTNPLVQALVLTNCLYGNCSTPNPAEPATHATRPLPPRGLLVRHHLLTNQRKTL